MATKVLNTKEWVDFFNTILEKLNDEIYSRKLSELFAKFAHVNTGALRSSMFYSRNIAGAKANYASVEVDRGGSHDFVNQALNAFDVEAITSEALYGLY